MSTDPRAWLAQIKAEADAATPGPWVGDDGSNEVFTIADEAVGGLIAEVNWDHQTGAHHPDADAAFIASSRTTVPALVGALKAVIDLADQFTQGDSMGREWGDVPIAALRAAIAAHIPADRED